MTENKTEHFKPHQFWSILSFDCAKLSLFLFLSYVILAIVGIVDFKNLSFLLNGTTYICWFIDLSFLIFKATYLLFCNFGYISKQIWLRTLDICFHSWNIWQFLYFFIWHVFILKGYTLSYFFAYRVIKLLTLLVPRGSKIC